MSEKLNPAAPLIEVDDLTVEFGAQRALDRISLSIDAGEIIGLLGPNGAGKSTFGRVLVGEIPFGSYSGTLKVRGEEMRFASSRAAHKAGVVLIHQEGAAVDGLSVGENVMFTIEPTRYGRIDWPALHGEAGRALDRLGLAVDTRKLLGVVGGVAMTELVEIARSTIRGGLVYVFDESTSALGAGEIRTLLERMHELAASGATIIFISHRIGEVLSICDRIMVLRDGRLVMDEARAGHNHTSIVRAMLGTAADQAGAGIEPKKPSTSVRAGDRVLAVRDWEVTKSEFSQLDVGPMNFELRKGEILGVFGPLGAGKTELLRSLYGLTRGSCRGTYEVLGRMVGDLNGPLDAIRRGIALVTAERQNDGLVPQLSLQENMMLGYRQSDVVWGGVALRHAVARRHCEHLIQRLGIRTSGPEQPISALSGGNQQKVLLARALLNKPSVLMLDEPTRGIDVGAKRDVYQLIRNMAAEGTAVIFTSLEERELVNLAHRVLVLRDGHQVALLDATGTSEHELAFLAGGGSRH